MLSPFKLNRIILQAKANVKDIIRSLIEVDMISVRAGWLE